MIPRKLTQLEKKEIENAHLNLDWSTIDWDKLKNPFKAYRSVEDYLIVLNAIRDPKNFFFTCKYILNIEPGIFQLVWLEELWNYPFPMLIANRGASKSFTIALYYMLRGLITQGAKIVITSSSFRQAKFVFEYMENIWEGAPVLRDLCGSSSGPRRATDVWYFKIGESVAKAIPLGDGGKIRGLRANYIDVEEFDSVPEETFEVVLRGFTATSSNPIENIKNFAKVQKLKDMGLWTSEYEEKVAGIYKPNQIILSGTAGWDFNHFAKYWKKYSAIIRTKGDKNKLRELLGEEPNKNLNYKDYTIIRIPIELMPPGMMDETAIANAKTTMDQGRYQMEYGCFGQETEIITDIGLKPISEIIVGDKVLTHKNRFMKVVETGKRKYIGEAYIISSEGNNVPFLVTPEHPFYLNDNEWVKPSNISHLVQSRLLELNNRQSIKLSDYSNDFLTTIVNNVEYIYPKPSQSIKYVDKHIKYKSCVKDNINLDYYFGLIIGYYVSEGSIGAKGKSVGFALDGHTKEPLSYYIYELKNAINKVFDREAKEQLRDNCCNLYFCSRLIAEFLKKICPGICYDKFVDPKILYSNKYFLKGFIVGYWHGDGSVSWCSQNKSHIKAGCCNKSLLSQVKNALSFFGFKTSLLNSRPPSKTIFRDKEYNTAQTYTLYLGWKQHKEFIKFLDEADYYPKIGVNFDTYKINNKKIVNFDGYVYNLEVETDNSYSLINTTVHNCCFSKDSNGFFPRSLIESCVCKKPILLPSGPVQFSHSICGYGTRKYIIGVDPASESDNFAISVVELWPDHVRFPYCWTTTRQKHLRRFQAKSVGENNFYAYCARKIRELMKVFPTEYISLDSQGGGIQIMECLHDLRKLEPGELPIWPIRKDNAMNWEGAKDWGYDDEAGLHMIEMVNMSKSSYVTEANHGLKKDMENKMLLFPLIDALSLSMEAELDKKEQADSMYDTLDDCVMDIEECKEEIASINHTTTQNGTDRWESPQIILPGNKRGRLRKDRYSALLMANALARRMLKQSTIQYSETPAGGFAENFRGQKIEGRMYIGADWFVNGANNSRQLGQYVSR